jgi:hypothetical protein
LLQSASLVHDDEDKAGNDVNNRARKRRTMVSGKGLRQSERKGKSNIVGKRFVLTGAWPS